MLIKKISVFSYNLSDNTLPNINKIASNNSCPETTETILKTRGFERPFMDIDQHEEFAVQVGEFVIAMIVIQERKAKRDDVSHKLAIWKQEMRNGDAPVTRKDERDQRKVIEAELAKIALPSRNEIEMFIDIKNQQIWLTTSSKKEIDEISSLLMSAGISLQAKPFSPVMEENLTEFIKVPNKIAEDFDLGDKASLVNEKAIARYTGQDLASSELETNVDKCKQVTSAEFEFKKAIKFSISNTQALTSIKYDKDAVIEMLEYEVEDGDLLHLAKQSIRIRLEALNLLIPNLFSMFDAMDESGGFEIS
ncbi:MULTISPECIES: recombination-associated protein RdgC [Vibrio]|uniref:recombination-associated protein RdgC n=1 Tax=Vibrio TaxID=662 RepID=UPI000CB5444F|nr:recombination-associated protein RdgC [Vibrio tasmaniensis]PMO89828.1 hypothetical protein BCT01_00670 [Vibrio tasmaniensis]